MKKLLKRALALVISLALVIGGVSVMPSTDSKASDGVAEMSVDSVLNFSTGNGDWRFNFNMNGMWPSTGDFEKYISTSVTATIRNAAGETLATLEGDALLESYKNGPYWMLAVWGVYTGSNAPAAGDTLTLSSGQLTYAADTTKVVNFAKETILKYDGENWSVYVPKTIQEMSVDSVLNSQHAGDWRFNFNMSGTWPTAGDFDAYTNASLVVTIKNAAGEVLATLANDSLENYKNGPYWLLVMWGTYTQNNVPVAGDTLTISAGQLTAATDATKVANFANELVLEYDGANWNPKCTYTDMKLVWGEYPSNKPNMENNYWDLYVDTSEMLPGTAWSTVYNDIVVMNGDTRIPASVKKAGDRTLSIFIADETTLPVSAPAGTKITIKAGQSVGNDIKTEGINIVEDFTMVLGEDGMLKEYIEYTYTDITIEKSETFNIGYDGDGNPYWDIYLNVKESLPGSNWATIYNDIVLMVDDAQIEGMVKRANHDKQLNLFIWGTELPITPEVGTRFVIKAGRSLGSDLGTAGINITADFVLEWNGTAWGAPAEWTDFVVNGLDINTAVNGQIWQSYFYTDAVLPGEAWGVVNNQQESYMFDADINGTSVTLLARKAGDSFIYVEIPTTYLPENADAIVTFKAGYYKSNVQSIGWHLTEDFVFYTNAYGWTTVDDAVVRNVSFVLNADSPSSLTANGFILDTSINDGVTANGDWSARIYPAYAKGVTENKQTLYFAGENGVFKNGAYQAVRLPLVKLYDQTYYVAISDVELAASVDDYYTIGGVFVDGITGKFVEFSPITVEWNGTNWKTNGTVLGDSGVQHDVNSDGKLDVKDLIRLICFMNNSATAVNAKQTDINFDGNTNWADVVSLKSVLVGSTRYDSEGLVYGIPVYESGEVIERMAYSSPAIGTLNSDSTFATRLSDDEIDAVLQEYKAAGFTLLNSEHVAAYKDQAFTSAYNEPLRVYLEAAERNGLGVIVCSDYLNAALQSDDLENGNHYNWRAVVDHMVDNMSGYASFRGFMLADELVATYAANYQAVAGYLHENYPQLMIHSSQLPVTAYDGLGADTLTLDTATNNTEELAYRDYVWNFAKASGTYTYDLYPLIYSENKIFGITTKSEHGVLDDWYRNLRYVAEEAKEHNYSFTTGITIQSCRLEGTNSIWSQYERYAPTLKADIGFQVYTAMAYGMQEFNFFTYEDHFSSADVSNAIADNAEVYAAVQAVNTEVDKFAHVYKAFAWKDTLDIVNGSSASTTLSNRLISATADGARVFVGCMKDNDGFDGYMVANADGPRTAGTAAVTLQFKNATEAIVYTNGLPERVALTNGVCTVTVGAGEGVFVIPIIR